MGNEVKDFRVIPIELRHAGRSAGASGNYGVSDVVVDQHRLNSGQMATGTVGTMQHASDRSE
jgi:hypothetical protein